MVSTAVPIKYESCLVPDKTYGVIEDLNLPSTSGEQLRLLTPPRTIPVNGSSSDEEVLMDITADIINCNTSPKKPIIPCPETPRKKALKKQLQLTERKLQRAKAKVFSSAPRSLKELPTFSKALTTMQLYHKKRSPWLPMEKITSLSIYYKSPAAYNFLRSKQVTLPAPSTLATWLRNFKYRPGYNPTLFQILKLKTNTMSKQMKECVLLFDGMSIKKAIEYSKAKDLIEGFEDLGELGRKPILAKEALVLMLRGIYSNWKIPIAFYFTENGVKCNELIAILKKLLSSLKDIGLNPLATICDQGAVNQQVCRTLNISIEKPYWELNGSKFFWIFDAPHLIKSVRNNLLNSDFVINEKLISFKVIENVYQIDKISTTGKVLTKLTDVHIHPNNFQKMSVKYAVQIFSGTMAAAIKTAIDTNQIQSEYAQSTADFIEIVNDLFDALNSRTLYSVKQCSCALNDTNDHVLSALEKAKDLFSNLRKISKKQEGTRPPCFDGVLLTIQSVVQIYEEQKNKGFSFLLTARLNQDVLENFFSVIRQRGGYSRNPTVRTFQAAFKANCVQNLMKPPKTSSYEAEVDATNLLDCSTEWQDIDEDDDCRETLHESSTSSESPETIQSSLEECAVVYFAGYLFKKCFDQYSCMNCKHLLSSVEPLTDENDILLFYKNYNINNPCSLQKPSVLLADFVRKAMKYFEKYFSSFQYQKDIINKLSTKIQGKLQKNCPTWYDGDDCVVHRRYLFDLMMRTLVYKKCKSISENFKSQKKFERLSILI